MTVRWSHLLFLLFALPIAAQTVLTGPGSGASPEMRVFENGSEVGSIVAFPGFTSGVTVAYGDFNGDSVPDLIAGKASSGSDVSVFNGATGSLLNTFSLPFGAGYTGGVFVAGGDVNGDGFDDVIVGQNSGAQVKVFDGSTYGALHQFFAFDSFFAGGARVAAADYDGDRLADIVVGSGTGAGHVQVFKGTNLGVLASFFPFGAYSGGVYVAAGDLDSDGRAELVAGAGTSSHVMVFSGASGASTASFFAFDPALAGGVRVACGDMDGDEVPDLIAGTGSGVAANVRTFSSPALGLAQNFVPYSSYTGGVFVGGYDPRPRAVIDSSTNVCSGAAATISVTLTGTRPWDVDWSDGLHATGINSSPYERLLTEPGTYMITRVGDRTHIRGTTAGSAVVTAGTKPVISQQPVAATVNAGQSASLSVTASGATTYQWFLAASNASIPGATSSSYLTPAMTQTTGYFVRVSNATCTVQSQSVNAFVRPATPLITATATSTTMVSVDWAAIPNAVSYQVKRAQDGGAFAHIFSASTNAFIDTGRTPGKSYLYYVRAMDGNGTASIDSKIDVATMMVFTDEALAGTAVKALHMSQLRTAVAAFHAAAGAAGAPAYTNAISSGSLVRKADVAELRSNIASLRSLLLMTPITWTDATITAGTTPVRAVHMNELRAAVQ